ncbi:MULTISPECIES: sugar ABC transporter ATP-binding protein [Ureibacillus]|jgi:ribose transport system ATP-binding protein|uniref:Ribose transport system ATP-binding protein n=1 Tax=Ureibacillus thermosphaericus TaxID=51173 RepID=A0A840PYS1_URETH|nr:sugar ABC transporter ATP-binding protein [Ureibacillus thermosphaericus]MBB5149368.1 ribose transport system ATP-binding protein [Ureibacillus thermosphaericus]NKZ32229.1 sugar ABC transporter ATP-binding protein [Ureibacillus thermosphaericus]
MIEMTGISKAFNGNVVLKDVRFNLKEGEIHALMGENGAGKSTLMKILSGIYTKDAGEIKVDGQPVNFKSPKDAEKYGIVVIHQELNILPDLTVAENLFLGKEKTYGPFGILKNREMDREAEELLSKLGLHVNPKTRAGDLSVGKQQIIEIAKAIASDAKYIVMDEPTAALTDREIKTLFETINELKAKGISFVYISHRMEEIFSICDRITILRDGQYVGERNIPETNFDEIVAMMVGRELGERFPERQCDIGDIKLEVRNLTVKGLFENISFNVRKGEVVGVAGLMGAGRTEVAETIFGYRKAHSGDILIDGNKVSIKSPIDAMKHKIGYVTEDRKTKGLVLNFSIQENVALANLKKVSTSGVVKKEKELSLVNQYIEQLKIRTSSPKQSAKSLSGGNQQKVVLAKWLGTEPEVLILDEPTRGVDIGAKKEIYQIINDLAQAGVAILMISSELPEIIGMADRVLVMHEGKLTGEVSKEEMTQERIMHFATGGEQVV